MKITGINVDVKTTKPAARPIADALQELPGSGSVEVTVRTDTGVTGKGSVSFGRIQGGPVSLGALIENELKDVVLGSDPAYVRRTHGEMLKETEYHGSFGITSFGIAAMDTALWDCLGNSLGVPCWKLWGRFHRRIPAYAMVGWLNYDDQEVSEICKDAVDQGFKAVKIKVGYPTFEEDLHRVEIVRAAVGANVGIMVDANQSLSVAEARVRGRGFERLGCLWWEEPIPAGDVDGYVELSTALDMPVAAGENLYSLAQFGRMLRAGGVDIVQPDLRRAGGPTALIKIGAVAEAYGIPYVSHGGGPVQLNIMACLPNAMYLETGLIGPESKIELIDGMANVPEGSGFSWE